MSKFVSQLLWHDECVTPVELDETGRWVTVRLVSTGAYHTACIDELPGFDRNFVPQVDAPKQQAAD